MTPSAFLQQVLAYEEGGASRHSLEYAANTFIKNGWTAPPHVNFCLQVAAWIEDAYRRRASTSLPSLPMASQPTPAESITSGL
jgi:hypothetical protein